MGVARLAGIVGAVGLLTACSEPAVKPIPNDMRSSIRSISVDVSGLKQSDTSTIAARGSDEGARRGAAQGARVMAGGSTMLGLLLMPVGAAIGTAKGAAEAQPELVVDDARASLRIAMQETDFGELLRSRLASSKASGPVEIVGVTTGAASAPLQDSAGAPVGHVIALEYRVGISHPREVNPKIGIVVLVMAQVQSPDRKEMIHKAAWSYCSERQDFVQMAAGRAAALRAEIDTAATILAEAIAYDLYVNRLPRYVKNSCMDFSDLPSGRGKPAGSIGS
ncbi:MAG: hypothetical protein K2Y40_07940 [Reyranella sp.]|jgi:uncharacterized protein (DUF1778 family)|nr:hypothetical protein [Reyranella sp.]